MTPRSGLVRHRVIEPFERFWFEEVPSDVFALARIAIGVAGLISLIGSVPVEMFWSPDGIFPLPGGGYDLKGNIVGSGFGGAVGWALFLTLLGSFVCMTVGLFTSTAVVTCFVGSVFQGYWNVLPLTSGHALLKTALFCLVWADCGARLSVDARRSPVGVAGAQAIWPLRLIRAQVAIVYLSSGLFKLLGPAWRDGSAIHFTTGQNVYGRIFQAHALPANLDWLLTAITYATMFWELSFVFLLLNRVTRKVVLAIGVAVHLGILATMEVGPFTWMMLACYVAFLDPHAVAQFMSRRFDAVSAPADGVPNRASAATVSSTPAA